jgi:quinohemoprotein ethanol dehydrogenase
LRRSPLPQDKDTFVQIVRGGALEERGMPKFGELTDAQLEDIRYYIRAQAAQLRGQGAPPNEAPKSLQLR